MTIEVTGVSTHNKGAELMLAAVRDHFQPHPDVRLVVDSQFGTYHERARYGLILKPTFPSWGRSRVAFSLMPPSFRKLAGLAAESDLDVLLDASGFAFGDQHPAERSESFADQVEAARKAGRKVVLLPQALGPFRKERIRNAFKRIVRASHLVYAREEESLAHVREVVGDAPNVRLAPDFTVLVKPERTRTELSDAACIVPNHRMVEKAKSPQAADAYRALMVNCIRQVAENGLRPVLLIHGRDDAELVNEIRAGVDREVQVLHEEDAIAIKSILGAPRLVIGSRFHALVSALSQGVPSIATSWSHKYEMLFREYGCEDMILPVDATPERVAASVHAAVANGREALVSRLQAHRAEVIEQTNRMWAEVDEVLGLRPVEAP
ncbi:MAG TPA: polysaccharide pyruvyl transferase family protein [Rhodothermales bacterium]